MPIKKAILIVLVLLLNIIVNGQDLGFSDNLYSTAGTGGVLTPHAKDYQALGINPANLAFPSHSKVSLGFLEFNYMFHSDALTRNELQTLVWEPVDSLTFFDKARLADNFTNKGFGFELNLRALGVSVNIPKVGGIAVQGFGSATFNSNLNDFIAHIIFNGFNYRDYFDTVIVNQLGDSTGICFDPSKISELFNGTELSFTSYTGISAGVGKNILSRDNVSLLGGVGVKRVWGMGLVDIKVSEGDFQGYIALPAGVGFSFADAILPELDSSDHFEPAGKGVGFDAGLALLYDNALKISVSITDLGSILYDKNVYELQDFFLDSLTFTGIDQYNYLEEIDKFLKNDEVFRYKRLSEKRFLLPAKFRFGTSYRFNRFIQMGVDLVVPLNKAPGNLENSLLGAGIDLNFLNIISISPGVTIGGNHGFGVPLGISFGLGKETSYQAGFASRDITSYFSSNDPILSGNFAFLKFNF